MADPVRPLDLSNLMRHAFMAGRGLNPSGSIVSAADRAAWVAYDPSEFPPFMRLDAFLSPRSSSVDEDKLMQEIAAELERARTKFPGPDATLAALVEEVGEVAKALMDESRDRVRKEAIQVAVMAIRLVIDGDATLDEFRKSKGLEPLTGP